MASNIYLSADGSAVYIIGDGPMGETTAATPLPTIAIASASTPSTQVEGDTQVVFRVTISAAVADSDTTFGFATCSTCSAVAGTDFVATSGTATIPSGETFVDIPVTLLDADAVYRPSRSFTMTISDAVCRAQTILITNPSGTAIITDDETFTPGASPYEDNVHPRAFIVPEGYTVQGGQTVAEIRTRIDAHYATTFQSLITKCNQNILLTSVASDSAMEARLWDMLGCAFLGLMDPAVMTGYTWTSGNPSGYAGGNTQSVYLTRAKTLALSLGNSFLRVKTSDGSPQNHPFNVGIACAFTWTSGADPALWTDADKQDLAESAIRGEARRTIVGEDKYYLSEQSQKGIAFGAILGVVLKGETITGNSSLTGQPYTTEMVRLAEDFYERQHAMCAAAEAWFDGKGCWHEGMNYANQAIPSMNYHLAFLATAFNQNIFTQYNWLRTYPQYFLQSIAPNYYTTTNSTSRGVVRKMGSTYERTPYGWQLTLMVPFIEEAEPAIAASWYYARESGALSGTNSTSSALTAQAGRIFPSLIYGGSGKPAAAPESFPEFLPCAEHGCGEFSLRTSNKFQTNGETVAFFCAQKNDVTSHQEPYFGALELHRSGHLLVSGSTHKNFTGAPYGIEGNWGTTYLDTCRLGIINLDAGPSSSTTVTINGLWQATNPAVSAPTSHAYCSVGSCYDVTTVSDLNQEGYSYIKYDQSKSHGTARATLHWREVVWLDPQNGGEPYLVVSDRVTVVNPARHIPVQMWKTPKKPAIADGASKTLIDGPGTGSANNPHTEGESGEWQTTTGHWTMTNDIHGANGRLTMKHIYPASRDVRIVGGDFNWSTRDLRPLSEGGRQDANKQDDLAPSTADTDSQLTVMRNEVARWGGRWRLEVYDAAAGSEQLFENVIHPGLATGSAMADVTTMTSTSDLMEGGVIKDSARWRVWMRPKAHAGTTVSSAFSYTVVGIGATSVAHHMLRGLSASTAYNVSRTNSGSNAVITVTPIASGNFTTTANGTLGVTL